MKKMRTVLARGGTVHNEPELLERLGAMKADGGELKDIARKSQREIQEAIESASALKSTRGPLREQDALDSERDPKTPRAKKAKSSVPKAKRRKSPNPVQSRESSPHVSVGTRVVEGASSVR
jgi:hypothetical protein